MTDKIPYWSSNRFLRAFIWKEGEDGCIVCPDQDTKLSLARPPPPLRDQPLAPKIPNKLPKEPRKEMWDSVFTGLGKSIDACRRFKDWTESPAPEKPAEAPAPVVAPLVPLVPPGKKVRSFDIQEIPGVMRKLNRPRGAAIMEKWFAGQLNYSVTEKLGIAEINQDNQPYPANMIDRTSVTMKWVLSFERAQKAFDLIFQTMLRTPDAAKIIEKNSALTRIERCLIR